MAPMGPEIPVFTPTVGTPSKARSGNDTVRPRKQQSANDLVQGDVVWDELTRISSDWVPEDQAAIRFRDEVLETLKKLVNGTPDYDTGWFYAEAGSKSYDVNHEIGAVPKRTLIYYSEVEEPKAGKDVVWEISPQPATVVSSVGPPIVYLAYGIWLSHAADGSKSFVLTAQDYILAWAAQYATGYLRVLVWR